MSFDLPVVAIVGRPNVGKSTLFNRVVGRRVAVVEDTPGITRDRLYAEAEHDGAPFVLADTGGILFGDDDPLVEQIRVQAEIALAEADVIIFLVDAREGLVPGDIDLANRLRPEAGRTPILLVANKADNRQRAEMASEFYSLGLGEIWPVSGLNGHGVAALLTEVVQRLPRAGSDRREKVHETRLAIVGRPNVGKSSILNAFTGEERVIVSNIPGTTRDAIDTLVTYKGKPIRLIDTAGIRRRVRIQGTVEYYMVHRAQQAIQRAECALVMVDASEGLTDGDKRVAKIAYDEGRALVFVVNKWDLMDPNESGKSRSMTDLKKEFIKTFRNEMPEFSYAPITFVSALQRTGMSTVLTQALKAVENWEFRLSTGQLNRLIQDAVFERPYTSKGRALKVYYSTQATTRPPTFVLFCNDADIMHFSYKRYLENRIRKAYPLLGTPIRLFVRTSKEKER